MDEGKGSIGISRWAFIFGIIGCIVSIFLWMVAYVIWIDFVTFESPLIFNIYTISFYTSHFCILLGIGVPSFRASTTRKNSCTQCYCPGVVLFFPLAILWISFDAIYQNTTSMVLSLMYTTAFGFAFLATARVSKRPLFTRLVGTEIIAWIIFFLFTNQIPIAALIFFALSIPIFTQMAFIFYFEWSRDDLEESESEPDPSSFMVVFERDICPYGTCDEKHEWVLDPAPHLRCRATFHCSDCGASFSQDGYVESELKMDVICPKCGGEPVCNKTSDSSESET